MLEVDVSNSRSRMEDIHATLLHSLSSNSCDYLKM